MAGIINASVALSPQLHTSADPELIKMLNIYKAADSQIGFELFLNQFSSLDFVNER